VTVEEAMKVVAFDMYKTLLDIEVDEDRPEAYSFLSLWLSYHGLTVPPRELQAQYKALCHREISAVIHQHPDIDIGRVFAGIIEGASNQIQAETPSMVQSFALLFRIMTTVRLSVYPGVEAMLSLLVDRVPLGVISNSQRLFTMPELSRFGLIPYFKNIVFSSDLTASKPNSLIYRTFLNQAGVSAEDVVYIGDNLDDDVRGAKQVGIRTIWINRSDHHSPPADDPLGPDLEVNGLEYEDLTQILLDMLDS
jgi:putative hydrolase of the HAD superfamily